mgnify:CR=1 FL=1
MNRRMTYNEWEELNAEEAQEKRIYYKKANRLMAAYYKRQRIMGYILIALGLVAIAVGYGKVWDMMRTIGAVVSIFGLYCTITRRMIYIDRYYFECQDRMRNII